jgi:endonuclease/exonuclease/phosphatase family metal-dependent hydrolase
MGPACHCEADVLIRRSNPPLQANMLRGNMTDRLFVAMSILKIVTLNLLNDLTFWEERGPLVLESLCELQPDLVALQEIALPANNAAWLSERLDGYSVHLCPYANRRGGQEGIAILSRLPVIDHHRLALGAQNRVAQRILVEKDGRRLMFANTHLFWSPFDDPIRTRQVRRILAWLGQDHPAILCGDLNAMPHYRSVGLLRQRFASAYELAHGAEPGYTFPTNLTRGPGLRHSARRAMLRLIGLAVNHRNDHWHGTVDYIFVDPQVNVHLCDVAFDQPGGREIYPSDHFGLAAVVSIPPNRAAL